MGNMSGDALNRRKLKHDPNDERQARVNFRDEKSE